MADDIVLTWTTVNRLGGVDVDHFAPHTVESVEREVTIAADVASELGVPEGRYERIHVNDDGRSVYRKQD